MSIDLFKMIPIEHARGNDMRDKTFTAMHSCFCSIEGAMAHGDVQIFMECVYQLHGLMISEREYLNS